MAAEPIFGNYNKKETKQKLKKRRESINNVTSG